MLHEPVMTREVLAFLQPEKGGVFVDCTVGMGGHALALLEAGATKVIGLRDRSTLFAFSLALVPPIVFNQQIITGRSLQPIHYQVFIGNYVALAALMAALGVLFSRFLKRETVIGKALCTVLAAGAIAWGFVECHYTVRVLDDANIERDLSQPSPMLRLVQGDVGCGKTVVAVTHDLNLASQMHRRIHVVDGRLAEDETVAPEAIGVP